MNSVDYYQNQFGLDLTFTSENGIYGHPGQPYHPSRPKRISIYDLDPRRVLGGEAPYKVPFRRIENKHLFLMCFFYSTLLDQSIHFSVNEEHASFDKIAQYPKFVGILSGCNHNMHPTGLLCLASIYMDLDSEDQVNKEFNELTEFIIPDTKNFFLNDYPQITGRLLTKDEAEKVVITIFETFANSIRNIHYLGLIEKKYQTFREPVARWRGYLGKVLINQLMTLKDVKSTSIFLESRI